MDPILCWMHWAACGPLNLRITDCLSRTLRRLSVSRKQLNHSFQCSRALRSVFASKDQACIFGLLPYLLLEKPHDAQLPSLTIGYYGTSNFLPRVF